jgi:hypothetical protein
MKWTQDAIEFLKANYAAMGNEAIGKKLGCSGNAARIKANRLGLHKPPIETFGMSKEARYAFRKKAEGCCPHCGKPCAPYKQCEERREAARLRMTGKPRQETHRPRQQKMTFTGYLVKVGNVTAHRML